ncbi:hypothetical protein BGZ94_002722 [Podila epigama]|nr:hypothetical protein BGZ94_002722 [Podila epigama]
MTSISFSTLSTYQILIFITFCLTILCILAIWYIHIRAQRRQYAFIFFFFWYFLGAVLGIINLFLVPTSAFPFFVSHAKNSSETPLKTSLSDAVTLFNSSTGGYSGYLAYQLADDVATLLPKSIEYTVSMKTCIISAHLTTIQCLGACITLSQWTWYIYRCLQRKLGVVHPKLINVLSVDGPSRVGADGHDAADEPFTPGFRFARPFSSLADIQFRLPAFVVAPIVVTLVLIRDAAKQLFFCCFPQREMDFKEEMSHDENEVFESWPMWSVDMNANIPHSGRYARATMTTTTTATATTSSTAEAIPSPHIQPEVSVLPPTLAAKLGVQGLDLSHMHPEEAAHGFDIDGARIKYVQDSWQHRAKIKWRDYRPLLDDLMLCIVWPVVVGVALFFISMSGRSYEVFPIRGGCGLPKHAGRADFLTMTIIDALSTAFSLVGCILAVLSWKLFWKQNGSVMLNIKGHSPSPAVLQLLKSTSIVRNFLVLCLFLNSLVFASCVVHLAMSGFLFEDKHQNLVQPLFQPAENDYAIFTVFISFALSVCTLLSLSWIQYKRTVKSLFRVFCCCVRGKSQTTTQPEDGSDDIGPFPFPFSLHAESGHHHGERGMERSGGKKDTKVGNDERNKVLQMRHVIGELSNKRLSGKGAMPDALNEAELGVRPSSGGVNSRDMRTLATPRCPCATGIMHSSNTCQIHPGRFYANKDALTIVQSNESARDAPPCSYLKGKQVLQPMTSKEPTRLPISSTDVTSTVCSQNTSELMPASGANYMGEKKKKEENMLEEYDAELVTTPRSLTPRIRAFGRPFKPMHSHEDTSAQLVSEDHDCGATFGGDSLRERRVSANTVSSRATDTSSRHSVGCSCSRQEQGQIEMQEGDNVQVEGDHHCQTHTKQACCHNRGHCRRHRRSKNSSLQLSHDSSHSNHDHRTHGHCRHQDPFSHPHARSQRGSRSSNELMVPMSSFPCSKHESIVVMSPCTLTTLDKCANEDVFSDDDDGHVNKDADRDAEGNSESDLNPKNKNVGSSVRINATGHPLAHPHQRCRSSRRHSLLQNKDQTAMTRTIYSSRRHRTSEAAYGESWMGHRHQEISKVESSPRQRLSSQYRRGCDGGHHPRRRQSMIRRATRHGERTHSHHHYHHRHHQQQRQQQSHRFAVSDELIHKAVASDDSDIEYSATISKRRHHSDPTIAKSSSSSLSRRVKVQQAPCRQRAMISSKIMKEEEQEKEKVLTMFSPELGHMITLPRGFKPHTVLPSPSTSPSTLSAASLQRPLSVLQEDVECATYHGHILSLKWERPSSPHSNASQPFGCKEHPQLSLNSSWMSSATAPPSNFSSQLSSCPSSPRRSFSSMASSMTSLMASSTSSKSSSSSLVHIKRRASRKRATYGSRNHLNREEVARTVKAIAPAPQVQPPTPPSQALANVPVEKLKFLPKLAME